MRLIRSHVVLAEPDKARAAVSDARRALAGDADKLKRLEDFAKELGIEG
jgi:cytochrome c-type biogenesis protein CcmH